MPTYAYACKDCGHSFDIVQSFSEDSLTVCPQCSGDLRKVFNAVGVVFKGSGFYKTDSKSSSSASSPATPSSDSKPAESKPAATSESTSSESSTAKPAASSSSSKAPAASAAS